MAAGHQHARLDGERDLEEEWCLHHHLDLGLYYQLSVILIQHIRHKKSHTSGIPNKENKTAVSGPGRINAARGA